jgi:hypothetical protein
MSAAKARIGSDTLALHVGPIPTYRQGALLRNHFGLDDDPPWDLAEHRTLVVRGGITCIQLSST